MLQVYETTLDGTVSWFPVVSLKALKEEIRLLQQAPWRSIRAPVRYVDLFMTVVLQKVRYVLICLCQWDYRRSDTCSVVYVSGITEGRIRVDLFMSVGLQKVGYVFSCLCQWDYRRSDTC